MGKRGSQEAKWGLQDAEALERERLHNRMTRNSPSCRGESQFFSSKPLKRRGEPKNDLSARGGRNR